MNNNFKRFSESITHLRFPLIVIIIIYHAYIAAPIPGHVAYYQTIYPLSLWIGETGVPGFFFISGLLFYYSSKTYTSKIKSRFRTLVIPYFIWNTIILLGYIAAYFLKFHLQINNGKTLAEYGFFDYIRIFWDCGDWDGGIGKPIYPIMWFVRNLMLLCLLSPIWKYLIEKTGLLLPVSCGIYWILLPNMGLAYESISFFCLGAFFPIKKINLMTFLNKYHPALLGLVIALGIADFVTHTIIICPYDLIIHRIALFLNVISLPLFGTYFARHCSRMASLSHMSFFIFCTHLPIVIIIRKPALWHPELSSITHVFIFIFSIIVITLLCITCYQMTKRFIPTFLGYATGNRSHYSLTS